MYRRWLIDIDDGLIGADEMMLTAVIM